MKPEYIIAQASKDGSDNVCQQQVCSDSGCSRSAVVGWCRLAALNRLLASCFGGCSCDCRLKRLSRRAARRHTTLLPPSHAADFNRVCVIVDLDETLVHSSFQPVDRADFVVPVEFDGTVHQVYVLKRPHVDQFLHRIGELFECVLFTASLAKYADPVVDLLDTSRVFRWRLFRDACAVRRSSFVKDLSRLGRSINRVVIVDNSPASYQLHPNNAVAVPSWFGSPDDASLPACLSVLEKISAVGDVYSVLGCPGTGYRTPYLSTAAGISSTRSTSPADPS